MSSSTKFNFEKFEALLNKTLHLSEIKDPGEEEKLRLSSNVKAITLLLKRITDPVIKNQALSMYNSIIGTQNIKFPLPDSYSPTGGIKDENSSVRNRKNSTDSQVTQNSESDLIKKHLFDKTLGLGKATREFSKCLNEDADVLRSVSDKFEKNIDHSKNVNKEIVAEEESFSSAAILIYTFMIFIIAYFIIRFL